jgi:hypothetical protein
VAASTETAKYPPKKLHKDAAYSASPEWVKQHLEDVT